MSMRVSATLECGRCQHSFPVSLFRTLWIEHEANRELVFTDRANVFACPECRHDNRVDFPLMATNAPRHFAVWYEPYPDPQIDADRQGYIEVFGEGNYFAEAPREKDWEAFKNTILDFESGHQAGKLPTKADPSKLPPPSKRKGLLDRILGRG